MGATLCVDRFLDPDVDEAYLEEEEQVLKTLNQKLADLGCPSYHDPESEAANEPYWNAMFSNSCLAYLHTQIACLDADPECELEFNHFKDPGLTSIRYIPIDFADPISVTVFYDEEDMDEDEEDEDEEGGEEREIVFGVRSCDRLTQFHRRTRT